MTWTHRDLARGLARWFLAQGWCDVAAYEVGLSPGVVDVLALSTAKRAGILSDNAARAVATHERRVAWRQASGWTDPPVRPSKIRPRIVVAEVKRTRNDLLRDLRDRKMQGYEGTGATHLYLGATAEAIGAEQPGPEQVDDLRARGLPDRWGVLFLRPIDRKRRDGGYDSFVSVSSVRPARAVRGLDERLRDALVEVVARSYSYRVLGDSPLDEGGDRSRTTP